MPKGFKDFSFRISSVERRRIRALAGRRVQPSAIVNFAIDETPIEFLERKPALAHVQLSDKAVKKLDVVAKKTGLSYATLIERAIDYSFRKNIMEQANEFAETVNKRVNEHEPTFDPTLEYGLYRLIEMTMPFIVKVVGGRLVILQAVGSKAGVA